MIDADDETEGASWNCRRRRSLDRLATIVRRNFPARREKRIERKVDGEHHRRIDETGPAPAEPTAEERRGRPEDAAGETRHQHQPADGVLGPPSGDLVQHDIGAGRQRGAAAHAENDPAGEIEHRLAREEQDDVARHGDNRAHHHHLARTVPRKGLGEPGRAQAHGDIKHRAARKHRRQAHAEIGREVTADHGRKADRPPSDELGDCQHQQDPDEPAVRFQEPHSNRRLPRQAPITPVKPCLTRRLSARECRLPNGRRRPEACQEEAVAPTPRARAGIAPRPRSRRAGRGAQQPRRRWSRAPHCWRRGASCRS